MKKQPAGAQDQAAEPKTETRKKKKIPGVVQATRLDRGSQVELGRHLISALETTEKGKLLPPLYDEGCFYSYAPDTGVWRKVEEGECRRIVQELDGQKAGKRRVKMKASDARGAIDCARWEIERSGFFGDTPAGLVFSDTTVLVGADGGISMAEHSSKHKARHAYDCTYVEEEPTMFLEALGGMFQNDADRLDKIRVIGEFAGCSLLGAATRLQRWLLLKGDGDDGKSTLIEIIRACFPPGSCSSIKPEDLEKEYERADLAGKLLNTVTEVKQNEYIQGETIKACSVGDPMRGRFIRQAPISFKPLAGQLWAANGFPRFADSSHGFWRRPIVVTFNHRFTNDPARDPLLASRIIATERQRLVCWLVRQGAAALARGRYIEPESHAKALAQWRGETDAIFEWVAERCIPTNDPKPSEANGWSRPHDLYRDFTNWCIATHHQPLSMTGFGRRLNALGYHEERKKSGRFRPLSLRQKPSTTTTRAN